jgi:membrane protein DedA with SNARE-associated domain
MSVDEILFIGQANPWLYPLLIIICTFILEDPTTIAVGILIGRQDVTYEMGLFSLIVGVFLGDLGIYFLGLGMKKGFFKTRKSFLVPSKYSIALARFVPGMRTITFLSAGFSQFPLLKFLGIIFPSAIIWTVLVLKFTTEIMATFSSVSPWILWTAGSVVLITIQLIEKRMRK